MLTFILLCVFVVVIWFYIFLGSCDLKLIKNLKEINKELKEFEATLEPFDSYYWKLEGKNFKLVRNPIEIYGFLKEFFEDRILPNNVYDEEKVKIF